MKNYSYMTQGTCARQITFSLEDGKLHDVHFVGGCPGNTLALSKLLEDTDAARAVKLLKGIPAVTAVPPVPINWPSPSNRP